MVSLVLFSLLFQPQTGSGKSISELKQAGAASVASHKTEAALTSFSKACALDPNDEDACYFLARTLFALDRWDQACEPFEKALKAAPKGGQARVHRAMALNFIALNRAADAERHFRQAVLLNPGPQRLAEDPRIDYGAFLFRQARADESLSMLIQAVKGVPGSARAYAELGRVQLHLGAADDAITSLEKAIALDPRASPVRLLLGRAYLQAGHVREGKQQIELARQELYRDQSSSTTK